MKSTHKECCLKCVTNQYTQHCKNCSKFKRMNKPKDSNVPDEPTGVGGI